MRTPHIEFPKGWQGNEGGALVVKDWQCMPGVWAAPQGQAATGVRHSCPAWEGKRPRERREGEEISIRSSPRLVVPRSKHMLENL
ncbi:hypothetical protein E2C01_012804 [Portunus trituberculatus]|uniref:Uncharacterized protein n=1 Tax=Portunus trituberculatus TaxID=210409 RepID=A0A5B7DF23_PORTR|nr:hypothetical protein [Portunus trituberculatus]